MKSHSLLKALLSEPILATHQAHEDIQQFLLDHIDPFQLPNPDTWEAESNRLREQVLENVVFRGVPDSWRATDLDVVWDEVIETDQGYRIKKLRYLALPGLWIPALLYEPNELADQVPAVLNVNGHVGPPGKAIDYKQIRCINLAKRGMLALNPEWLYFGELRQDGFIHNQAAHLDLCGVSGLAVFYLAMQRGLDVLSNHNHTDPSRVAVTGLSGGGWQTIILSALDDRVRLAAPTAGYIGLDYRVKFRADIGDIEQNPADLATIADYPILTAMLAPRPALLLYNEEDDCCFQTKRARPSVYDPIHPLYEAMGKGEAFQFHNNIDPGTHNYDLDNRQQFYRFINHHFLPEHARIHDEIPSDEEVRTEEELTVGIPDNNENFISLANQAIDNLPSVACPTGPVQAVKTWQEDSRKRLRNIIRYSPLEIAGVRPAGERTEGKYHFTRYSLELSPEWTIPVVDMGGTDGTKDVLVVIADQGREGTAQTVEDALNLDKRIIIADILLQGECTFPRVPSHQYTMVASAAGLRMLGIQVAQLMSVYQWAKDHTQANQLTVAAHGPISSTATLMAAALTDVPIDRMVIIEAFASLKQLTENAMSYDVYSPLFCFGLLTEFDMRELISLSVPVPVDIIQPFGGRNYAEVELAALRELYACFDITDFQTWQRTLKL